MRRSLRRVVCHEGSKLETTTLAPLGKGDHGCVEGVLYCRHGCVSWLNGENIVAGDMCGLVCDGGA